MAILVSLYFSVTLFFWTLQQECAEIKHMIRKAELLNAKTILKRMETQREMMGMTRQDISYLTDIPYSTLTNNFQKNKVPMFDDLYRMSLSIGMPMDELVSEEEPAYSLNKDNMLYWKEFTPSRSFSETFIQAFPDKVALARTFNAMAQKSDPFQTLGHNNHKQKSIDDLRFLCIFHTLTTYEVDSIFLFMKMSQLVNVFFSNAKPDNTLTLYDYRTAQKEMTLSLWAFPCMSVQNLFQVINEKFPSKFPNLSAFLKEAKLNSQTYGKYLKASEQSSTPSTDTVYRICKLLDIRDIDNAIRSRLPDIPTESVNAGIPAGIIPHAIEDGTLRETLKPLPYLAMFYDCVFSLSYDMLWEIAIQIYSALSHPYYMDKMLQSPLLKEDGTTIASTGAPYGIPHSDLQIDYLSHTYPGDGNFSIPVTSSARQWRGLNVTKHRKYFEGENQD